MINASIAIDIQRGRIMACQSYIEVVAITESGFQLIFGFFWLLRLIEFQRHKTGNSKQRVSSCNPSNHRHINVPDLHKLCLWSQNIAYFFMFCWPCISIHPCDKNQLDALFILSLYRQSTSTCFGHICSPSTEGIRYIQDVPGGMYQTSGECSLC